MVAAQQTLKERSVAVSQRLLLSVAEELKLPLINIARRAELATRQPTQADFEAIQATADAALYLLDSYVLSVQMAHDEGERAEPEPVSVSSMLYDVGAHLQPMAKAYDVRLGLEIDGRYGPVMAHRQGLEAALISLGYALVEALPAIDCPQLTLQLSAHRCRWGIVAGMYCETDQVTTQALRQGRQLYGRARQPLGAVSHASGAGVFVADALLRAMHARLTVSRHHRLYGLGVVLQASSQLQLV